MAGRNGPKTCSYDVDKSIAGKELQIQPDGRFELTLRTRVWLSWVSSCIRLGAVKQTGDGTIRQTVVFLEGVGCHVGPGAAKAWSSWRSKSGWSRCIAFVKR